MRVELMAGTTNVVRFPGELREEPSLELLREIVPDVRTMPALAEAHMPGRKKQKVLSARSISHGQASRGGRLRSRMQQTG
jgi:hypothetical protein